MTKSHNQWHVYDATSNFLGSVYADTWAAAQDEASKTFSTVSTVILNSEERPNA